MSDRSTAPSIPTRCECGDGARMATPCHRTERDGPGPSLCCGSEPPALHSRATCRVRCARQLVPFRGGTAGSSLARCVRVSEGHGMEESLGSGEECRSDIAHLQPTSRETAFAEIRARVEGTELAAR